MTDSERLKQAFVYTKNQRYVRNQQDFTERLGIDKASMSQMISGHHRPCFCYCFLCKVFPDGSRHKPNVSDHGGVSGEK